MNRLMERLAEHVIEKRNIYTAIAIILTIFFGWQCRKLSVRTVFADLLPQQHPYIKLHNEIRNTFGGGNQVYIMVQVRDKQDGGTYHDVFNPETLNIVRSITKDLLKFHAVDRYKIMSLASDKVKNIEMTSGGMSIKSMMYPEVPKTEQGIRELRSMVYGSPMAYPGLVSLDSKKALITVDFFEEQLDYRVSFQELSALRKKYEDKNHIIAIAGEPMHIGYIESYVPGAIRIFGCSIIAMLVMFYLFFRSKRGMIMPVFASLLSAVWGLGFLAMMNFNLDPLVLVFPFLIGALTACHAVQVVKRYKEEVYHRGDGNAACKKIISSLFVPGVGGAITDSTGILIICITPISILQKICIVCGFWVFGTIFISMFLLPILLSYFPLPASRENYAGFAQEGNSLLDRMLYHMGRFICGRGKYGILAFALFITVWAFFQQLKLPVGNVVPGSEVLWPWHRYNVDSFRITFAMPMLNPLYVIVEGEKNMDIANTTVIRDILNFLRYMERTPDMRVMVAMSYLMSIPAYNQMMRDNDFNCYFTPTYDDQLRAIYRNLVDGAGPGTWDMYVDASDKKTNIIIYCRDKTAETIKIVTDRVNEYIRDHSVFGKRAKDVERHGFDRFVCWIETLFRGTPPPVPEKPPIPGVPLVHYRLAGGTVGVQAAINETLVTYNELTTWIAYFIVFFVVAFSYQSFIAALFITTPLLTSTFLTQAFMTLNNPPIPLTTATLPVASVGIGLGEDYAMYIVSRIIEEYRDNKRDLDDAIAVALGTSGKAVVYIGITFICGMGFWAFSQLMFQALMGLFLTIILLINILGALFVVPSFVSLFKPKFITGGK